MSIAKGDWVMVIRGTPCCGHPHRLGATFKVRSLIFRDRGECKYCDKYRVDDLASGDGACLPTSMLKKIDPPSSGELTGVPLRLKEPV